jgi:L-fuculose-phosphate aldolase
MSTATGTQAARQRVAEAARRVAAEGLVVGTAGNLSERVDDVVAVTPTGGVLCELTAEQIVVVDLDGRFIEGDRRPTSELGLHLAIYREFDAGAVVHSHAPMATVIACVLDELPVMHYHQLALGGPVRVGRYETFGTEELARATLDALQDRTAALMANHGAISYGNDLEQAVENSLLLEWLCSLHWHSAALGTPRFLDDQQRDAVVEAFMKQRYGERSA